MSGKVEGRLNKLRDMEESDEEEDDEPPPPMKVGEKLSFGKKRTERKESPASVLAKHRTPIERMLESPGNAKVSKRRKLAPRRIMSDDDTEEQVPVAKPRARRSRKEDAVPESDDDSDEDLEGFMQRLGSDQHTPNRSIRKSTRLQASPTLTLTPDSRRPLNAPESGNGRKSSLRSPLALNRKRVVEDSGSDSEHEESDSVFL